MHSTVQGKTGLRHRGKGKGWRGSCPSGPLIVLLHSCMLQRVHALPPPPPLPPHPRLCPPGPSLPHLVHERLQPPKLAAQRVALRQGGAQRLLQARPLLQEGSSAGGGGEVAGRLRWC